MEAAVTHHFTRLELYNLVWSEPMRDASARFEISDVGLAKACRKRLDTSSTSWLLEHEQS
jgi:hypothetical protein